VIKLYKTIQDLKMKIETIKKSHSKTTLEVENLEKRIRSHRYKHHQQNTSNRKRISGAEDNRENTETIVKENAKC
jgi:regulator of replication initiation timing